MSFRRCCNQGGVPPGHPSLILMENLGTKVTMVSCCFSIFFTHVKNFVDGSETGGVAEFLGWGCQCWMIFMLEPFSVGVLKAHFDQPSIS